MIFPVNTYREILPVQMEMQKNRTFVRMFARYNSDAPCMMVSNRTKELSDPQRIAARIWKTLNQLS